MTMQLGRRICRHVCANFSLPSRRSYSSGPLPPLSDAPSSTRSSSLLRIRPAFGILLETAGYCGFAAWLYRYDFGRFRLNYAKWKGEKRKLEMLKKLDREKYESNDAYVEMLGRELDAMKAELLTGEPDLLKLEMLKREKEALEAKIHVL